MVAAVAATSLPSRALKLMSSRALLITVLLALAGAVAYFFLRGDPTVPTPEPPVVKAQSDAVREEAGQRSRASSNRESEEVAHRLTGLVQSSTGPLAGAVVSVQSAEEGDAEFSTTVRSGGDGRFVVEALTPGRYSVSATAAGHLPGVRRGVEVSADTSVTLALEAGGHPLRGTISDVTGGPVEAAAVRLTPLSGIAALRRDDSFATLSDDEGAYVVHVPPGRYRMEAAHEDYAAEHRTVEVGPGAQSQDFELVPMGVIEGVVKEESSGAPVPGARVVWERERQVTMMPGHRMAMPAGGGMVKADSAGHFRIRGLPPGAITLSARASARLTEQPTVVALSMAEHVSDADVFVTKAHDLRGRVVASDDSEEGIAGAEVRLLKDARNAPRAQTDKEGYFVLEGVAAGPTMLLATASGWLPSSPPVGVDAGADDEVTIALTRAPTIIGRVEPPMEAEITTELRAEAMEMGMGMGPGIFMMGNDASTRSDAEGNFELGPAKPGRTVVVARVADGRAGETIVEVGPEGATDVVVQLQPRATVTGVVRNTSGTVVAQAVVLLREQKAPGAPTMRLTVNGRDVGSAMGASTEDGRFEIGGVAAGTYEITVTDRYGEAMAVQGAATLTVPEGAEAATADVMVDAHDGVIAGVVLTADGDPVPDVWVQAALLPKMEAGPGPGDDGQEGTRSEMRMIVEDGSGSSSRPPVLTDDDGRFEFVGLRDADYELTAEAGGGQQRVTAVGRPGDNVKLELADLATVEGAVTLDGQPLESFGVRVEGPTSRSMQVRDPSGHFEIGRLDPGTYTLVVTAPDGSGRAEVTLAAGETATKNIVLEHDLKVRGRVVDAEGNPVQGAMVAIGGGEGGQVSIEHNGDEPMPSTDEDGRFEVSCAAGPRVLVVLSSSSPAPLVVRPFVAQPGKDQDLGDLKTEDMGGAMVREQEIEAVQ